mmetsp:Transcript_22007/g.51220  ORF Transcript_22007/g.51220 Transcript_22007/m.51220 type:complete len:222 (-) Transcript_22007:531-1196(-)
MSRARRRRLSSSVRIFPCQPPCQPPLWRVRPGKEAALPYLLVCSCLFFLGAGITVASCSGTPESRRRAAAGPTLVDSRNVRHQRAHHHDQRRQSGWCRQANHGGGRARAGGSVGAGDDERGQPRACKERGVHSIVRRHHQEPGVSARQDVGGGVPEAPSQGLLRDARRELLFHGKEDDGQYQNPRVCRAGHPVDRIAARHGGAGEGHGGNAAVQVAVARVV